MNRREIIKNGLMATCIAVALPKFAKSTPEIYSWVAKDLERRRRGDLPRFDSRHYCKECQHEYLCPDRYDYDECGPSKEGLRLWGIDGYNHTCTPCAAQYDVNNRAAWWEAHGV